MGGGGAKGGVRVRKAVTVSPALDHRVVRAHPTMGSGTSIVIIRLAACQCLFRLSATQLTGCEDCIADN